MSLKQIQGFLNRGQSDLDLKQRGGTARRKCSFRGRRSFVNITRDVLNVLAHVDIYFASQSSRDKDFLTMVGCIPRFSRLIRNDESASREALWCLFTIVARDAFSQHLETRKDNVINVIRARYS